MKAILVIDMPSSCATCEIRWGCKIWDKWKGYDDRLDECPLKPIPSEACEMLVKGLDAMEKMKAVEVKVVRRTE